MPPTAETRRQVGSLGSVDEQEVAPAAPHTRTWGCASDYANVRECLRSLQRGVETANSRSREKPRRFGVKTCGDIGDIPLPGEQSRACSGQAPDVFHKCQTPAWQIYAHVEVRQDIVNHFTETHVTGGWSKEGLSDARGSAARRCLRGMAQTSLLLLLLLLLCPDHHID